MKKNTLKEETVIVENGESQPWILVNFSTFVRLVCKLSVKLANTITCCMCLISNMETKIGQIRLFTILFGPFKF